MTCVLVSEAAVRRVATRALVRAAVRDALVAAATTARLGPVAQLRDATAGWSFGIKTGAAPDDGLLGFKYGCYWPANRSAGRPAHSSFTVLLDEQTGLPAVLVSAGYLNGLRTAAANAVAVETLARPDARTLAVLGCGRQAECEVRAIADVRPLERIELWNRTPSGAEQLATRLADLAVEVRVATREAALGSADIVTTVSAARGPLLHAGEVKPGTHISAMGADQPGKQELDPALLAGARLFADAPAQSRQIGEFQHAAADDRDRVIALGDVLTGRVAGRRHADDVTIFDSSGIALQDLFAAQAVVAALPDRDTQRIVI